MMKEQQYRRITELLNSADCADCCDEAPNEVAAQTARLLVAPLLDMGADLRIYPLLDGGFSLEWEVPTPGTADAYNTGDVRLWFENPAKMLTMLGLEKA